MKILDCTIRDGGYYTNWDFSDNLINSYLSAINNLPIEYVEVGYRSYPVPGYLGKYFYCPVSVLQELKAQTNKKLVIILNEKDIRAEDAEELLDPIRNIVTMVRIAIDPLNFDRAIELAKKIKVLGFEVAFNVMYMSRWKDHSDFIESLPKVDGIVDYFYMVDSFGGVYPDDVKETIRLVRSKTNVNLGFHGHNNLELALSNTLVAIEEGVEIVDATITGMGRGAGNLKTELLLTALNSKGNFSFDFNELSRIVDDFSELQKEYNWGTNLPYMVSGANSLPQKQVMDWVSKRYFSFNSIIRALSNQTKGLADNLKLKEIELSKENNYSEALIVGGGPSVHNNCRAINDYLNQNPNAVVIHASSTNAQVFRNTTNKQYFCLIGNEGHRLEKVFGNIIDLKGLFILPPYPRKMGTYVPRKLNNHAFELKEILFTDKLKNTHTAIALQTAISLGLKNLKILGYDGYMNQSMNSKEQELFLENEYLFNKAKETGCELISLTPTVYNSLERNSIYEFLI